jgi:hypothetical protein
MPLLKEPKIYVIVGTRLVMGEDGKPFDFKDIAPAERWAKQHAFENRGVFVRIVNEIDYYFRAHKVNDASR